MFLVDILMTIPQIVWGVIFIVLFASFWAWFEIRTYYVELFKNLQSIFLKLSKYKTQLSIDEINEVEDIFITAKYKNDYFLKDIWVEFDETIEKDRRTNKVFNTLQAEDFFNVQSMVISNIKHLELVKAMPGILTALGLLGTFLGILLGLYSVNVLEGGQVTGIEGLINGLAGKFASSIVALFLSIIITIFEKRYYSKLVRTCMDIQRTMNRIFPRRSTEKLLIQLLKYEEEQTAALKSFSTDMSGHLKQGVQEGINPLIEKLVNSIEEIKKEKQQSSTSAISSMVSDFKTSLTGAAGAEITNMAAVINEATAVMSNFASNNKEFESKVNYMIETLDETIRHQQSQFKYHVEQVNDLISIQASNLRKILDDLEQKMSHYIQLTDSTKELQVNMQEVADKLLNAGENFVDSAGSFEQINGSIEQLKQLSEQDLQRFNQSIEQWNTQVNAIKSVENSISNILGNVHDALLSYSAQTNNSLKEYLTQYDEQLANVTKHFSVSIQEFDDKLESLNEILEKKVGATSDAQ